MGLVFKNKTLEIRILSLLSEVNWIGGIQRRGNSWIAPTLNFYVGIALLSTTRYAEREDYQTIAHIQSGSVQKELLTGVEVH